ncbi:hypothetical protein AB0M54_46945 [Actinoplanes sp. NPDC051470]|uniref:hypothetical protein n=1 Tax=unclassified Actinoplanes TaxID=2626549 RepID=UPI003426B56E
MASINWDTVVTAAATAAFVTMAVEYFAKPLLEARKERILDIARARRELDVAVRRMTMAAGKVGLKLPDSADLELKAIWRKERERHYELMRAQTLQVSDDMDRYALAYIGPASNLVMRYAFCVHGIVLSLRTHEHQAEIIAELGKTMAVVITPPRPWQYVRFWRAIGELERRIADTEVQDEPDGKAVNGTTKPDTAS